jgi:hypothetical protein
MTKMHIGSPMFQQMSRTLSRVMWTQFIDEQVNHVRTANFRASLVADPLGDPGNHTLAKNYEIARVRNLDTPTG